MNNQISAMLEKNKDSSANKIGKKNLKNKLKKKFYFI
jgi:hypothetical protein